jgi:ribonuclease HI
MTNRIIAACDGACKGNPGPAAWAWVVAKEADGRPGRWEAGPLGTATNNIAELTALEQLLSTVDSAVPLEVRMDSQYAMNAVTKWLPGWKKRGWKTAAGSPVANRDLIVRIDALLAGRDEVEFVYVPAHQVDGDPLNAFADQAASAAAIDQLAAGGSLSDQQARVMAGAAAPGSDHSAHAPAPALARAAKPKKAGGSIPAKFPGTCGCGQRYEAGTMIAKGPKGWGHPQCATSTSS